MIGRRTSLWSPAIGAEGGVLAYGHYGRPLLAFPSQEGPAWQYEERGMIGAIAGLIEAGRVKVYAVDSFDSGSWYREGLSLEERAQQHGRYEDWIVNQVVPFIRADSGDGAEIALTGVSFGAYHAANFAARYPDVVSRAICFSGVFDNYSFLDGYWDDTCYFHCPVANIANMDAEWVGKLSRVNWIIATGEHDTLVQQNRDFSQLLWSKGIPNHAEFWNGVFGHDWPWWREHLRRFV